MTKLMAWRSRRREASRAEQALIALVADQQTVRTGLLPAPRFLRRLAKALPAGSGHQAS